MLVPLHGVHALLVAASQSGSGLPHHPWVVLGGWSSLARQPLLREAPWAGGAYRRSAGPGSCLRLAGVCWWNVSSRLRAVVPFLGGRATLGSPLRRVRFPARVSTKTVLSLCERALAGLRPRGPSSCRRRLGFGLARPCRRVAKGSYLVDPASSHMLVSKIKPCMSKYKLLYTVKLRMAH